MIQVTPAYSCRLTSPTSDSSRDRSNGSRRSAGGRNSLLRRRNGPRTITVIDVEELQEIYHPVVSSSLHDNEGPVLQPCLESIYPDKGLSSPSVWKEATNRQQQKRPQHQQYQCETTVSSIGKMALSKGEIISVLDYPEPTFVCGTLWTAPCCSNGTQDSRIICRRQSKDDWDEIDSISHQKNIQSLVNKKQRQRRPVTPDQLDFSYDDDHHHDNDDDKWSWQRMVHESAWPRLRHSLTQYKKRGQPFPYDRLLMLPDDHEDDNNDCTTDSDSTTSSATDAEDYESDFAYTTLVHVAAWKAPPALMLLLLDVMTTTTANAVSLSGLSHCSSAHSDRTASQKSIETTRQYLLCGDAQGNTPLHLACANLEPNDSFTCEQLDDCKSDDTVVVIDFAVIKNLLVLGQEALEVQNNAGDTPLHLLLASDAFEQEPLRYLNITSKSKSLNMHDDTAQDGFSRTASKRELAAEEAIVSLLHMTGDGLANSPNNTGMTPLHVAIANPCHEAVTRQLIRQRTSQLAVTMADQHGMVPLHYLGAFGRTSRVLAEELIAISPDSIGCLTINGDTPLHLLVTNAATILKNQTNAVPNVDVHTVNQHIVKLAKLLVGTGSEEISPLLIPNDDGMTPLHCCAEFHAPAELTRLLMDSNNTGYYGRIASVLLCKAGSTALHLAVSVLAPSTNTDWFDKDTAWVRNVESNIFALATREACAIFDAHDQTPLMVAVQNKRVSTNVIKRLLETLPKSASTPNSKGYLPIHFACQNRRIKVSTLKALIQAFPASLSSVTKKGNTALAEAAKYRMSFEAMELLIGAHPEALHQRNIKGERPLDRAIANSASTAFVSILEKATNGGQLSLLSALRAQRRAVRVPPHPGDVYRTR